MEIVECPSCHFNQKYKGSGLKLPKCRNCGSYIPIENKADGEKEANSDIEQETDETEEPEKDTEKESLEVSEELLKSISEKLDSIEEKLIQRNEQVITERCTARNCRRT